MKWYDSIICISDLQEPFSHPDAYHFLAALREEYYINDKKTKVVNQGDEADFHAMQKKYVNDPDGMSAGDELAACRVAMSRLWDLFPVQDICISNHLIRPWKTAMAAGLPRAFMRSYAEVLGAPSTVRWADYWVYNNIMFEHGEGVSGPNAALNAAIQNGMSTSIGHQHGYGGVKWQGRRNGPIFGLNTGCLIDESQYAFAYSQKNRKKITLGAGVIIGDVGHYVPMIVDEDNRWRGYL